jgi:hypothetical protein
VLFLVVVVVMVSGLDDLLILRLLPFVADHAGARDSMVHFVIVAVVG